MHICKDIDNTHNKQLQFPLNARFQLTLVDLFVAFFLLAVSLRGHRAHLLKGDSTRQVFPRPLDKVLSRESMCQKQSFNTYKLTFSLKELASMSSVVSRSVFLSYMTTLQSRQHILQSYF